MTTVNFERIKEQTQESIALDRDDERERNEPIPLEWALSTLKSWTRFYLKKNQPKNFFRITRMVPKEFPDNPSAWRHRLQLFIKNKLDQEYVIDTDTFYFISNLEGWEKTDDSHGIMRYVYSNKAAVQVPQYRYEVSYISLALHLRRTSLSNTVVKKYEGANETCIPYRVRRKVDFKIISINPI